MTEIALKGLPENVEKFLKLITYTEGTDKLGIPYNTAFKYKTFFDLSKHPEIKTPFFNPAKNKMDYSTAAGRYQFIKPTWDRISKKLGLKDFSAVSQDKAAIEQLKETGSYNDILNGNWIQAIEKNAQIWASLPGSKHKQPTFTLKKALAFLGTTAGKISTVAVFFLIITIYFLTRKK